MKNIFYLISITFLFYAVFTIQENSYDFNPVSRGISTEAEATSGMGQTNMVYSTIHVVENTKVTTANTTSKIAEDNDRKDVNNDSLHNSGFNKEADGSLSLHIQQMLLSNLQLSGKTDNIKVIAVKGRVVLQGTVHNEEDRANIAQQVENMAGVDGVDNQLTIQ